MPVNGNGLVGPGGMVPYGGGGGGRRHGGFVQVRDPAHGFFVAGSSISELNGVYVRKGAMPASGHSAQLVYFNEASGWFMAMVDGPASGGNVEKMQQYEQANGEAPPAPGYEAYGGKETEWLFVDSQGKDRFGHAGDTIIPGAGTSWGHLHRVTHRRHGQGSQVCCCLPSTVCPSTVCPQLFVPQLFALNSHPGGHR